MFENSKKLLVLEVTFEKFQGDMVNHMRNEEAAFSNITSALKDIVEAIHESKEEARESNESLKKELLETMAANHYSSGQVDAKLTCMRESILREVARVVDSRILAKERSTVKTLRFGLLSVTLVLALCGWWYINVATPNFKSHTATHVGVKG